MVDKKLGLAPGFLVFREAGVYPEAASYPNETLHFNCGVECGA
jgi:hypothetical protein